VRLSVVVPTWNERESLPRLAASLVQQEVAHELVVSDGGSPDGTAALAAELGAKVVHGPRSRGGQLARGAAASAGELLLFVHADSRLAAGALAALQRAFEDARVIATGMRQEIEHAARFYRLVERAADRRVRAGWVYGDSGLCVRRRAYDAVGGFRDVPVFEDLDLSARLRRIGRIELVGDAALACSPRRWEREGRLRRTAKNWALTALWAAGVAPARLARFYAPHG
jgi:rSAM/selenodomain-associated transferase 2